jgi:hypothetical protein
VCVCDELLPFVIAVTDVVKVDRVVGSVCVPVVFQWFLVVLSGNNV